MSNIGVIIEERPADIGNFIVGRLLPFRTKRMVGPFIFIDHMGPAVLSDHQNLDIGPHPHIGLSTLTYLFEGSVLHRDSLGSVVEIKPGEVNWMTAGRGIVHSERTPEYLRHSDRKMHGLQIWVALPAELEEMAPEFFHIRQDELPVWSDNGVHYRLLAGNFMEHQSPVPVYSNLYLLELKSEKEASVQIGHDLFGEAGIYILEGSVTIEGNVFGPRQLLVAKEATLCEFAMSAGTTVYLFGGEPFAEDRHIYWNFVATNKDLIEKAKERWAKQEFPLIPGESGFVPLPEQNPHIKMK